MSASRAQRASGLVPSSNSVIADPKRVWTAKWASPVCFVAAVSALVGWLLSLFINEDDLVCERTLFFDRSALFALAGRPGKKDWRDFNGGSQGRHRLWIHLIGADVNGRIQAPAQISDTHTYLFHEGVVKYNVKTEKCDEGPLPIREMFPALAGTHFETSMGAAVERPKVPTSWIQRGLMADTGRATDRPCLFRASEMLVYRVDSDRIEGGPWKIADVLTQTGTAGFIRHHDDVCRINDDEVYLFRDASYCRYNLSNDTWGGVKNLASYWHGLKGTLFADGIHAVTRLDDDRLYLFRGNRYGRYRLSTETIESEQDILSGWPGLKDIGW